jgi:hypothetical protein
MALLKFGFDAKLLNFMPAGSFSVVEFNNDYKILVKKKPWTPKQESLVRLVINDYLMVYNA